jgi:hypothetical protein
MLTKKGRDVSTFLGEAKKIWVSEYYRTNLPRGFASQAMTGSTRPGAALFAVDRQLIFG